METPTYKEAKEAKQVLIAYLEAQSNEHLSYEEMRRNKAEIIVLLALSSDYFLE